MTSKLTQTNVHKSFGITTYNVLTYSDQENKLLKIHVYVNLNVTILPI